MLMRIVETLNALSEAVFTQYSRYKEHTPESQQLTI